MRYWSMCAIGTMDKLDIYTLDYKLKTMDRSLALAKLHNYPCIRQQSSFLRWQIILLFNLQCYKDDCFFLLQWSYLAS